MGHQLVRKINKKESALEKRNRLSIPMVESHCPVRFGASQPFKMSGVRFLAFPLNPLRSRIGFSILQGSMQGRKPTGTLEFDGNRPFSFRGREYCLLKFNGLQFFNSFFFSRFPQIAFPQAFYPPKPLHPLIAQPNPMHKGYRESELKWCRYRAGGVCAICAPRGPG